MTDYKARVKMLIHGVCSVETALETLILDLVEDGVDKRVAERIIFDVCMDLFEDEGFAWINDYRKLRLNSMAQVGGCPTTGGDFPDPMNIEQFAQYIGKSPQWCYNNTRILPKTQGKRGGKMVFYRADVDKWQAKRLNKGAE